MTLVVGIDPSSRKIAVVAHHVETNSTICRAYTMYKTSERFDNAAIGRAVAHMHDFLAEVESMEPTALRHAWVEDPIVGRGGVASTMKQVFIQGVVRGHLAHAGFHVYGVHPSTWKADVVGNGRAEKSDVLRAVKTQWPKVVDLIGSDGDLADAAAIRLHGSNVLGRVAAGGIAQATVRSKRAPRAPRPAQRLVRRTPSA